MKRETPSRMDRLALGLAGVVTRRPWWVIGVTVLVVAVLASGARFGFLGRSFMYGVAALGERGGEQVVEILSRQLQQVMEQVGAQTVAALPDHRRTPPGDKSQQHSPA